LLLVAWRVQNWLVYTTSSPLPVLPALHIARIEPILYRVISVSTSIEPTTRYWPNFTFDRLLRLIDEKPPSLLKNSVQYLLIDDMCVDAGTASLTTIAVSASAST
jgi:hypothetical protein